ncbi:MAG: tyrosine-type recombinase/integrase [Cyanobacteria bacterium J06592_8]
MTNKPKRRKGQVGVSAYNGVLRLSLPRFLYGGKRKYLYLRLADNTQNRKFAEAKAKQIEADILYERFDPTLDRYRPQQAVKIHPPQVKVSLAQIYEQYIETRHSRVRPGTWKNNYQVMLNHIKRSPFAEVDPNDESTGYAQKFFDWASQKLTPDTCRRLMTQLNACINWAIESKRVELVRSPFEGMATKARKLIKASEEEETDINPFTRSERDAIIEAFKTHPQHSHYYSYVCFCFYVGGRPSEVIALTWSDIAEDLSQINFSKAIVAGVGGKQKCEGLKTQKKRTFPCNCQVKEILSQVGRTNRKANTQVFTSVTGKVIDIGYFREIWQKILDELGIEYRKPYQMRHTFITLCIEAGLDAKDIAKLVGNSAGIIYKHYAGYKAGLSVPEI